jgi:hypothetical protein
MAIMGTSLVMVIPFASWFFTLFLLQMVREQPQWRRQPQPAASRGVAAVAISLHPHSIRQSQSRLSAPWLLRLASHALRHRNPPFALPRHPLRAPARSHADNRPRQSCGQHGRFHKRPCRRRHAKRWKCEGQVSGSEWLRCWWAYR